MTNLTADRLQSVLAYLLLNRDHPVSRSYLAFQFWPDLSERQARNNLRQALHQLRHILPDCDQFIEIDTSMVQWRSEAPFHLDVADFEESLKAAKAAEINQNLAIQQSSLEKALDLYRGDLIPSCYDEWILPERERLKHDCETALERLAQLLEQQRLYTAAIPYVQRLLQMNPVSENGYRLLMLLYALKGDRANALRAYRSCVETLRTELGIEPEQDTQEMYQRLLENPVPVEIDAQKDDDTQISLVGQDKAWAQLVSVWQQVKTGPQFVMITGEAGIGKTRLAEELLEWTGRQGINTARTRAYAAEGQLSYEPLTALLQSPNIFTSLKKLDPVWLVELSRLLPDLSIEYPDLPHPEPLQGQRQRLFHALARAMTSIRQPLLLLIDDLQWCDLDTLEWLHFWLRSNLQAHVLVLTTIRSEDKSSAALQSFLLDLQRSIPVTEIPLGPLDAAETVYLATLASREKVDVETGFRLFAETEGNPLFVLEMLRSGLFPRFPAVHGDKQPIREQPRQVTLPPKVSAIIKARLEQLSSTAGDLASLAAVIGRAFSYNVLKEASGIDETTMARALDELLERRIVRTLGGDIYDFSHDKLREVAYEQIGITLKRLFHRNVAATLEGKNPNLLVELNGQIGNHYEQAGLYAQAIPFYQKAAQVSQRIGAIKEAISLLKKALTLLKTFPKSAERDAQELDIQTSLGVYLVNSLGHGAPEVTEVFQKAQTLSRQLGRPETPAMLRALGLANISHARYQEGQKYGQQLHQMGVIQKNQVLQVEGDYMIGVTWFWLGNFLESLEHLQSAIGLYQPEQSKLHIALFSQDPHVICLSRLAFTLWCLGYIDQALATSKEAVIAAQNQAHPFSQGYAMFWDLLMMNHLRFFETTEQQAKNMITFCQEQELDFWLPQASAMLGWAKASMGSISEGIQLLVDGMEKYRAMGAELHQPFYLSLLAEMTTCDPAQVKGNLYVQAHALDLIEKAFTRLEAFDERWCESEVYRRQGEVYLATGNEPFAEQAFENALKTAVCQEARTMELRAAVALGRLWLKQGKVEKIRWLLAPLCDWFGQSHPFPDLNDAADLLASV